MEENKINSASDEKITVVAGSPDVPSEAVMENTESMDDYLDELNRSFKKFNEGDLVEGTVIGVGDNGLTVDLGTYTEAFVPLEECSDDPAFSIKQDILTGDIIKAVVIEKENREGNIILSMKQGNDLVIWDELAEDFNGHKKYEVKISQAVNGGVIAYLKGIRGFIPASQLSLSYVENLEEWVGRYVEVVIMEAEKPKLVLSAKEVLKEEAVLQKTNKIKKLTAGQITSGTVERIESYGVFVNIGEGLTGLVHISQISNKFLKSPKEVVKLNDTVRVKILEIKGERISLSMKALSLEEEEKESIKESSDDGLPTEYSDEGSGISFGDLIKNSF